MYIHNIYIYISYMYIVYIYIHIASPPNVHVCGLLMCQETFVCKKLFPFRMILGLS